MIIFNERKYIEDKILKEYKKPEKMGMKRLIRYLASYYFDEYAPKGAKEYSQKILDEMNAFNFYKFEYREFEYINYIKTICQKYRNGNLSPKLIENTEINITKKEIEIVQKARTEKEQKVLFTFYVLAKVINSPTGWVNRSISDIFRYANVSGTNKEKHEIIHALYVQGLLELSNSLKVYGYKVELQDDISDVAISITVFDKFGNQYLDKYKDGWKMCENCGKMIKIKAPNQKYCKKCGEVIQRDKIIAWKKENSGKSSEPA